MKSESQTGGRFFSVDELSPQKVAAILAVLVGSLFLLQLLPALFSVLAALGFALVFTALLDPIVDALEQRNINRIGSILLVFLSVTIVLLLFLKGFSGAVGVEIGGLGRVVEKENFPEIVGFFEKELLQNIPLLSQPEFSRPIAESGEAFVQATLKLAYDLAVTLITSLPWVTIIVITVFFFLKDGWKIKRSLTDAAPNAYHEISIFGLDQISRKLGRFVREQTAVFLMICGLYFTAFVLLGLPYPLFMAVIVAMASLTPWFGGPLGFFLALAAMLSKTQQFGAVGALAAGFAAIQLLDNTIISAKIMTLQTRFHPVIIMMLLLAGGTLWGLAGLLLIVPISNCLYIAVMEGRRALAGLRLHERKQFATDVAE